MDREAALPHQSPPRSLRKAFNDLCSASKVDEVRAGVVPSSLLGVRGPGVCGHPHRATGQKSQGGMRFTLGSIFGLAMPSYRDQPSLPVSSGLSP